MGNSRPSALLMTLVVGFLVLPAGTADRFVKSARVDLNGDGQKEHISLESTNELGDFVLRVGKATTKGRLWDRIDGFIVVDLDTHDVFKEVAVHTPGPSDDDVYLLYWYDGEAIKPMARLARWPRFTGYGIVYVRDWMGFWERVDKYVLDRKARTLKRVPQEFYYVGVEATVQKSIPVYETREKKNVVAHLAPKTKALILLHTKGWYLVKSVTGLIGWAEGERAVYTTFSDLPLAD